MDHATTFSYRHSLNGREAAAHLLSWTSEQHYVSSAHLCEEMYTEVVSQLRSTILSVFILSVPTFCPTAGRTATGLKLEDEEEIGSTLDRMVTN